MVSYKDLNTVIEAGTSQTRDRVGNGDGGQTAAILEAAICQTRDGICDAIINHCFRNHYVTGVFIIQVSQVH